MIHSTLSLIYTPDFKYTLLIEKQKPEFHKDKWNGLGGKVEQGETAEECIVREVKEESGLDIPISEWRKVGTMSWTEWEVEIFVAVYKGKMSDAQSMDYPIKWYEVNNLPKKILTNVPWLIPLGIDYLTNPAPPTIQVSYPS